MTNTSLLSFEVDVLNTDVADDVSCDGLATLVIDRETAFPLDRIWRLVCQLICLIRLLVYRRTEFHNHTVLSCTCASP